MNCTFQQYTLKPFTLIQHSSLNQIGENRDLVEPQQQLWTENVQIRLDIIVNHRRMYDYKS